METFESKIIFAQKFPDANPTAMLKRAEELSQASGKKAPPIPFEDFLKRIDENYVYEPKPDALKTSAVFAALAVSICRNFEIDTEIVRKKYEIEATMDLYFAWYPEDVKQSFASLLNLADDFSISQIADMPDRVRVSMSYHTHNRRFRGNKGNCHGH